MKRGVIIASLIGAVVIIGAIILLLGNRQPASPAKTTLTIWSPFDEGKTFQTISQKWLSSNANVTLDFHYIAAQDAKDYEAQVVNAIANGKGPDIWLLRSDWLPKHVNKLKSATSSGSAKEAVTLVKKNIQDNLVDQNVLDGALYAMPLQADALALIYNQSLLDSISQNFSDADRETLRAAPATWDDLKKQVQLTTSAKNGVVTRSGIALGTASNTYAAADVLSAFLVQNGVTDVLSSDQKSVAFNLPKVANGTTTLPATDAVAFDTSFAQPSSSNFAWTSNLGDPLTAFENQKTVALIGYYSTLQTILRAKPNFTITVAPLPLPTSAAENRVDYGVTWSGAVNKQSSQTSLAWSYLAYLGTNDPLSQYAQATGRLNISQASQSGGSPSTFRTDSGSAADLFKQLLPTITSLKSPEWQFRDQVLQDTINLVVDANQSPQTAVDSAAARFKKQFLGS